MREGLWEGSWSQREQIPECGGKRGGEDRDTSSLSLENKEEKAVKKKTP